MGRRSVSDIFLPPPRATRPWTIIDFLSADVCVLGQIIALHATNPPPATGGWTTANTGLVVPFVPKEDCTVIKLGWVNGTVASGSSCMAIYDSAFARLVTTGSVAKSGTSAIQWTDTADQALVRDRLYYIGFNHSATTATHCAGVPTMPRGALVMAGCQQQAVGAVALPDPFVPAAISVDRTVQSLYGQVTAGFS